MIDLCVLGPGGRMGQQVCDLAIASDSVRLASAVERKGAPAVGSVIASSSISIGDALPSGLSQAQVYIDFTSPAATAEAAHQAIAHKTAAVVGTTGLDSPCQKALDELSNVAPVFVAANFSPGVALLLHLAKTAAAALGSEYDLEVVEMHHRNKVDAPSGTALALGEALAEGRGLNLEAARESNRDGQVGPRRQGEIGMFAVRGGDIVGEHTAFLIGDEERIEIAHRAQKRSVFAAGALRAARWVVTQPPGRYSMSDLLGF
ncbi:MAG: 4-hydroxy-tetrahydrodipicolinate reductase [Myxococcales bacterium]|nr:4-hydroxy-tetrahydrodipicolinate reductase [Myxococcales bacterium]